MAIFTLASSGDDANEIVSSGVVSITLDGTTTGAKLDGTNHAGFRFTGITIANGATISSAILKFPQLANYSSLGAVIGNQTIYGQAADNPINFSVAANNISARPRTTATGTKPLDTATGSFGSQDIDVTTIVQEIVNRAGWSSGNAIVLMFIGTGVASSSFIQPYMWDYFTGTYASTLTIATGGTTTSTFSTS